MRTTHDFFGYNQPAVEGVYGSGLGMGAHPLPSFQYNPILPQLQTGLEQTLVAAARIAATQEQFEEISQLSEMLRALEVLKVAYQIILTEPLAVADLLGTASFITLSKQIPAFVYRDPSSDNAVPQTKLDISKGVASARIIIAALEEMQSQRKTQSPGETDEPSDDDSVIHL